MRQVVIVGAGHAGSQLAVSLRQEGFAGTIVLIAEEADLPYHKPPLSKAYLKDASLGPQMLRAASGYDQAGVRRITARVDAIDPVAHSLRLSDGERLGYSDLVLATGARNRALPGLPPGLTNVHSLRTLADAARLRDALPGAGSAAVIGGGFIGLEVAASLAGMGKRVIVLEAADRVLGRVAAPETSDSVAAALADLGVDLRTACLATGFAIADGRVTRVDASVGGAVRCDLLLVGIGARPNTEIAQAAGLKCANGVVVDASLRSSAPDIYAIGDCASFPHWQTGRTERVESVQNATDQARTLARRLATGVAEPYRMVPWFWSDIGPLKLQIAGLSAGATRRVVRREPEKLAIYHLHDETLVAVETINAPADHMMARKLLELGLTPQDADILAGPVRIKALIA